MVATKMIIKLVAITLATVIGCSATIGLTVVKMNLQEYVEIVV
jgi:hypothetical protein